MSRHLKGKRRRIAIGADGNRIDLYRIPTANEQAANAAYLVRFAENAQRRREAEAAFLVEADEDDARSNHFDDDGGGDFNDMSPPHQHNDADSDASLSDADVDDAAAWVGDDSADEDGTLPHTSNPSKYVRNQSEMMHVFQALESKILAECSLHLTPDLHNLKLILMRHGYMASSHKKPKHAFELSVVELGVKMREKGVAYQTIANVFLGTDTEDARQQCLYEPLMNSKPRPVLGAAKLVALVVRGERTPKLLCQRLSMASVQESILALHLVVVEVMECSNFIAGSEEEKKATKITDIGMIIISVCRHGTILEFYDADTERHVYADTAIANLQRRFPNRKLVFCYDVVCKLLSHMLFFGLVLPFIMILPALHCYAHGKGIAIGADGNRIDLYRIPTANEQAANAAYLVRFAENAQRRREAEAAFLVEADEDDARSNHFDDDGGGDFNDMSPPHQHNDADSDASLSDADVDDAAAWVGDDSADEDGTLPHTSNPSKYVRNQSEMMHVFQALESKILAECSLHLTPDLHNLKLILMRHGYMASSHKKPKHAFELSVVELGVKMREKGVAYQTIANVFLGTDTEDARQQCLYEPLMNSKPRPVLGAAKLVALVVRGERTPKLLCQRLSMASVQESILALHLVVVEVMECSNFIAGSEEEKKATKITDIGMIIISVCRHGTILEFYDADTERHVYADTAIANLQRRFPNRKLVFCYDVVCKLLSHMLFFGLVLPFIMILPALHCYAHGKGCRCRFSSYELMGTGTKMDGEVHERTNSALSRSIGLSQKETLGNRLLALALRMDDIARGKLRTFAAWTCQVLTGVFVRLSDLENELGPVSKENRSSYASVVHENRKKRRLIARDASRTSGGDQAVESSTLRLKVYDFARTIISLERMLNQRQGTEATTRMKAALAAAHKSVNKLLREYNEMPHGEPLTFTDVKKDASTGGWQDDAETVYWRLMEELFWQLGHLTNTRDYYVERQLEYWPVVRNHIERLENPRHRNAAKCLLQKAEDTDAFFLKQAHDLYVKFTTVREGGSLPFCWEHLKEIQDEFDKGELGALGKQHLLL
ncbi:hypothetical protein HDU98_005330 [Podochytrium sp. JEL0797]|nr:hypothetical protein HDU98_005330 [Podochytrium sp. JEL0797]